MLTRDLFAVANLVIILSLADSAVIIKDTNTPQLPCEILAFRWACVTLHKLDIFQQQGGVGVGFGVPHTSLLLQFL